MVKLICYNIEYCEGIEGVWYQYFMFWKIFFPPKNIDLQIIESLKKYKPDILSLVEIDTGSFRSKKDEVKFLEHKFKMHSFVEAIKYPFKSWLKLFHYVPILNHQANAIISRYKISKTKYHLFHEGTKRVVIETTIHCPQKITLLLAHLALGKRARKKQIQELCGIVNKIKNPVILMGDFNTFNGETEIKKLMAETHLKDKARLHKYDRVLTQPAWHPKRRLDYVLTSPQIKVKKYSVLKFPFSDHLPLFVEFRINSKNARKKKTKKRKKKTKK